MQAWLLWVKNQWVEGILYVPVYFLGWVLSGVI